MAETTNLSMRVNRDLKEQAEKVFNELGMNMTTAITIFMRQAVRQGKIPFEITLNPDAGSSTSMRESIAASERIWQNSVAQGTDGISYEEIEHEIAEARAARKARRIES